MKDMILTIINTRMNTSKIFLSIKHRLKFLKLFFSSEFDIDFYENSSYEDIKILTVEIETNPDLSSGCRVRFEYF